MAPAKTQTRRTSRPESGSRRSSVEPATNTAFVETTSVTPPPLTGNVVHDARILTGFTVREFADFFDVSQRTYYQWQELGEAPRLVQTQIEALHLIGATLCRGLSPAGIRRWLEIGEPSVLRNIQRGRIDLAQAELEREQSASFV